ncbi:hypothetical protein WA026_016217 [Henosepilachna vigintioctopunctata]|uniref:Mitochondrial ribonuclease P catalytic subunit n=1 Tax=Henosepilachna vigintioctopunctata TaxID=420089 RepID=A0AAW1TUR4_9CUCU
MFIKSTLISTGSLFRAVCYSTTINNGFNLKRTLDKVKRQEDNKILKSVLRNRIIECPKDVDVLRSEVINSKGNFSERNVDRALLNHFCHEGQFRNGINYIEFLNKEIKSKLNLFLVIQTFRMYYYERHRKKSLSNVEEEYLISLYKDLRNSFPILDVVSIECAILGLSITKEWKKCLDLLQEASRIDQPSNTSYNAVIASAFLNGEEEIGWMLIKEMFEKHRTPSYVAFSAYIEKLEQVKNKTEIMMKLEKLFTLCKENDIILPEKVIEELGSLLRTNSIQANLTSINKRGCCSCCQQKLDAFEVTNEMFEELKDKFITNVIVGKNIFSKTTPEEFARFQSFLKTIDDCSVVIDGLNVAYSVGTKHSSSVCSAFLANVVAYFVNRNKKVLVLGREHMNRWPKKNWNYVKNNAKLFLTQDLSQDDPYLLYAALHLGKNTMIVTRDLMRSHLFLLKEPSDKIMFSRWLSQRQYQIKYVTGFGKVIFNIPMPYMRTIQKNGDYLHIPYQTKEEKNNESNETSNSWLCIHLSS